MYSTQASPPQKVTFGWIGEAWQRFTAQGGSWALSTFIYGIITLFVMILIELVTIIPTVLRTMPASGAPAPDPTAMMRTMLPTYWLYGILMGLASILLNAFFGGGLLVMANKAVRNYQIGVGDLFSGGSSFIGLVIYQLIFYVPALIFSFVFTYPIMKRAYSVPMTTYDPFSQFKAMIPVYEVGLLIDLIPIFLLAVFWPAAAMIADGENVFTGLGKSWGAMKRSWLPAFFLMLVVSIVTWISMLPCFLGLLVTLPICAMLSALMYRDMVGMPHGDPQAMPGYYGQPLYPGAGYYGQPPANPGTWPPPPGHYTQPPDQGNPPAAGGA